MTLLLAVSLVASVLALWFLSRTVYCARHGRLLRAGSSCLCSAVFAAIASAAIIITISYYGYERLTAEQDVAHIEFRASGPDEFRARLMVPGQRDQLLQLRGDEWQIDARMISWKPPVTLLGLDPIYRLERLSGRYAAIDRERNEARTVHELAPTQALDLWRMARRFPVLLPGVDAYYGSATYLPMADGARFAITLSRDALRARPDNLPARTAVGRWGVDRT